MGYYPTFLELTDRPCVVIGGGAVAERKVEGLLRCGAKVTVISPALTERLDSWVKGGKICSVRRAYQPGDLAGYELVFVATDKDAVNTAVSAEGRERHLWVNVADDPAHCDFILPSVLRRGELVVAVATGGLSPALSRAIRQELEAYFSDDYATVTEIVGEVRRELKQRSLSPSVQAWRKALDSGLRLLVRQGNGGEAKAYLLRQLGVKV